MHKSIRVLVLCLFSLLLLPVWASDLTTYKEVYQKHSEEILQSYQLKFTQLQQQYRESLGELKTLGVKQGDLAKAKSAIAESERFQKEKSMPDVAGEGELPEIKAFQSAYVKQYNRIDMDMTAELGALTAKFEQALDRLQKELVKAERLDDATAVQKEREKTQIALKGYADQMEVLKGVTASHKASQKEATTAGKPNAKSDMYLVVDLSKGVKAKEYPVTYLADVPKGGWHDEYKTDKLVLRKLDPRTFVMGSPESELGRAVNEPQHEVTLTRAFYIGVFELTQRQWELVMGAWPSYFRNPKYRAERPVERVSYNDIRGVGAGANWPASDSVDASSFMGVLRSKTGRSFDLPTEAQWEYACRAGTVTALNSGKNLTSAQSCHNLNDIGRYLANSESSDPDGNICVGTAKVGSYLPNAWGLFDMHGNVYEWCLDWYASYSGAECDPKGALSGSARINRGGSWGYGAGQCRSACRSANTPDCAYNYVGFRVALSLKQR